MRKERLEAYNDAIVAIIITLMVLEIKPPAAFTFEALIPSLKSFFIYIVSFLVLTIYWINHYHLLHDVKTVKSRVLWFNNMNLFIITLFPFATIWLGQSLETKVNHSAPAILYAIILFLSNVTYYLLANALDSDFSHQIAEFQQQKKACLYSLPFLLVAIGVGLVNPLFSVIIELLSVAGFWGVQVFSARKKRKECCELNRKS